MDVSTGEFKDLASCNHLCVNRSGSLALVAGKKLYGLVGIGSSKLSSSAAKSPRISPKHDIVDIEFSPSHDEVAVEAFSQKVAKLTCREGSVVKEWEYSAHNRDITGFDWNPIHPDIYATTSIDNYILGWDMRQSRHSPSFRMKSNTFPAKVSWEKVDGRLVASCHDCHLKIWDSRHPKAPVLTQKNSESDLQLNSWDFQHAKSRRIFSLDFHPLKRNWIATGSADSAVRLIDVSANRTSLTSVIHMPQKTWPVKKVKHSPFGKALVSLVSDKGILSGEKHNMYHTRDNNLTLWTTEVNDRVPAGTFIHTFYGHNDVVLELDWVRCDGGWKLITWSRDNTIKLWPISGNIIDMCGVDEDVQRPQVPEENGILLEGEDMAISRESSVENSRSDEVSHASSMAMSIKSTKQDTTDSSVSSSPTKKFKFVNLRQEFNNVVFGDRLSIETLDTSKVSGESYAVVVGETNAHRIYLQVKFPKGYAYLQEVPRYTLITGTTLDQATGFRIQHRMQMAAQTLVESGEQCLKHCLEIFREEIEAIFKREKEEIASGKNTTMLVGNDAVPFPRTSGARFCGLGQLVCFGWSYSVKVEDVGSKSVDAVPSRVAKTPRALSALSDSTILMRSGDGSSENLSVSKLRKESRVQIRRTSKVSFDPRFISSATLEEDESDETSMLHQFLRYKNRFSGCDLGPSSGTEEPRKFVTIYDTLKLLKFDRAAAKEYRLSGPSIKDVCLHNSHVARKYNNKEASRLWAVAATCCYKPRPDELLVPTTAEPGTWFYFPNISGLIKKLIDSCASYDLQTAAIMCSVFAKATWNNIGTDGGQNDLGKGQVQDSEPQPSQAKALNVTPRRKNRSECLAESRLPALDSASSDFGGDPIKKPNSMNKGHSFHPESQSMSLSGLVKEWERLDAEDDQERPGGVPIPILDPAFSNAYDSYRLFYAEMLRRCGQVMTAINFIHLVKSLPGISAKDFRFNPAPSGYRCVQCKAVYPGLGKLCGNCKSVVGPRCYYCRQRVNGLTTACFDCGHGGHLDCMATYFSNNESCLNCGCECPKEMAKFQFPKLGEGYPAFI